MGDPPKARAAVVTVSDGVASGARDDASGRAVRALLQEAGFDVARSAMILLARSASRRTSRWTLLPNFVR